MVKPSTWFTKPLKADKLSKPNITPARFHEEILAVPDTETNAHLILFCILDSLSRPDLHLYYSYAFHHALKYKLSITSHPKSNDLNIKLVVALLKGIRELKAQALMHWGPNASLSQSTAPAKHVRLGHGGAIAPFSPEFDAALSLLDPEDMEASTEQSRVLANERGQTGSLHADSATAKAAELERLQAHFKAAHPEVQPEIYLPILESALDVVAQENLAPSQALLTTIFSELVQLPNLEKVASFSRRTHGINPSRLLDLASDTFKEISQKIFDAKKIGYLVVMAKADQLHPETGAVVTSRRTEGTRPGVSGQTSYIRTKEDWYVRGEESEADRAMGRFLKANGLTRGTGATLEEPTFEQPFTIIKNEKRGSILIRIPVIGGENSPIIQQHPIMWPQLEIGTYALTLLPGSAPNFTHAPPGRPIVTLGDPEVNAQLASQHPGLGIPANAAPIAIAGRRIWLLSAPPAGQAGEKAQEDRPQLANLLAGTIAAVQQQPYSTTDGEDTIKSIKMVHTLEEMRNGGMASATLIGVDESTRAENYEDDLSEEEIASRLAVIYEGAKQGAQQVVITGPRGQKMFKINAPFSIGQHGVIPIPYHPPGEPVLWLAYVNSNQPISSWRANTTLARDKAALSHKQIHLQLYFIQLAGSTPSQPKTPPTAQTAILDAIAKQIKQNVAIEGRHKSQIGNFQGKSARLSHVPFTIKARATDFAARVPREMADLSLGDVSFRFYYLPMRDSKKFDNYSAAYFRKVDSAPAAKVHLISGWHDAYLITEFPNGSPPPSAWEQAIPKEIKASLLCAKDGPFSLVNYAEAVNAYTPPGVPRQMYYMSISQMPKPVAVLFDTALQNRRMEIRHSLGLDPGPVYTTIGTNTSLVKPQQLRKSYGQINKDKKSGATASRKRKRNDANEPTMAGPANVGSAVSGAKKGERGSKAKPVILDNSSEIDEIESDGAMSEDGNGADQQSGPSLYRVKLQASIKNKLCQCCGLLISKISPKVTLDRFEDDHFVDCWEHDRDL